MPDEDDIDRYNTAVDTYNQAVDAENQGLAPAIPRLPVFRLDAEESENQSVKDGSYTLEGLLNFQDRYAVLGEAGQSGHFIVLNIRRGQILPGLFHLERFREVDLMED